MGVIKIKTKLTVEELSKLIDDLKKIVPSDISGIYSKLIINQKSNDDGEFDTTECFLKINIIGKTFREYANLSDMTMQWYEGLKPEMEDYSEQYSIRYEDFNKFIESLIINNSGVQSYSIKTEPRIIFSDLRGAYIHNVISIEFDFGDNIDSSSIKSLYPKIGEFK